MKDKKILVGLSGGVDSAVAALILKNQGFEVIGYTLKFGEKNNKCCMLDDAAKTAAQLKIKYITIDIYEEFETHIIQNFINEYMSGATPSPCPGCNIFKFGKALEYADTHGIDYVATGHYAKIKNGELYASRSGKDQSYFLSLLPKHFFRRILLPLGDNEKTETRKIAEENGLYSASKKDSQDICFVKTDYRDFLKERGIKSREGNFVDKNGNILGKHEGFFNYTTGQRFKTGGLKKRMYITGVKAATNEVTVGAEEDLFSNTVEVENFNLIVDESELDKPALIKIRSKDSFHSGKVVSFQAENKFLKFETEDRLRAVTPGQLAVVYIPCEDGSIKVAGGGRIM